MKYDFASIGEVLIDFTPAGNAPGGAALFQRNLGGAPGNAACALAKLGRRSAFIGMAGDDAFGRFCKAEMAAQGVDVGGFKLSETRNTTLAFVHLSDGGDRSFSFYRKNMADVGLGISDLPMGIVKNAKFFHFGSVSLSDEPARSATIYAVEEAIKSGSIITYDPNLRFSLWGDAAELKKSALDAMRYAGVIKISDDEAEFLFGSSDYGKLIPHIKERFGARLVIVTRGPRGAVTEAGGRLIDMPAYDVKTIDTTGSGDCFFAGALHCLLSFDKPVESLTPEELTYTLDFANASGSLASAKPGAVSSLPSVSEIDECMKNCMKLTI